MKNLVLLLTLCLMAKVSFAKTVNPSMDDDLDFKYETNFEEGKRGFASTAPEPVVKPQVNKEKPSDKTQERDVASDVEVFETTNENGIKYWKY